MLEVAPPEDKLGALFRLAIKSGAADAVALHIRRGEPINGRDGAGLTPLMLAAVHNKVDVCTALLDAGADLYLKGPNGRTANDFAVELGHAAVTKLFSEYAFEEPEPALSEEVAPAELDFPMIAPASAVGLDLLTSPRVIGLPPQAEMNGWEADVTVEAPRHNAECAASAQQTQRAMSTYRRVSKEADWSDVELDLPEIVLQQSLISHGQLAASEELIANGLTVGFVNQEDICFAAEADYGHDFERAHEVLLRVLDDLGILVESSGPSGGARGSMDSDELNDVLEFLSVELPQPVESANVYAAQARKIELIKREDEERIGRRMDSALSGLSQALASLPADAWQIVFSTDCPSDGTVPAEEDDSELSAGQPITDDVADDEQIDFDTYVAMIRDGMPQYGRESMVPRPRSAELSRLLRLLPGIAPNTAAEVAKSVAGYEQARDQLVTSNLRLAMSIAYGHRYRGLPLEDLMQEANVGLMRAAEKFDFRRGFKFSTYATAWIRQSITRALADTVRVIRVPVHMVERINAVYRARRELEYGREHPVEIEEIAARVSLPPEAVRRIIKSDSKVLSLEECGPEGQPNTPDPYCIVDPDADPYFIASRHSLARLVERMLVDCKDKERDVLLLRFGLNGLDGMTLEEVGQKLNVTRERIRQIEAKALTRFRHPSRRDELLGFAGATDLSDY